MKQKIYYKILDNTADDFKIVKTTIKDADTYDTFREAKKELADTIRACLELEKEGLKQVKKLKESDIEFLT